jgi:hypothetical protein
VGSPIVGEIDFVYYSMRKRLLIAALIVIAFVVWFYVSTAFEKQQPVEITTPSTPATTK